MLNNQDFAQSGPKSLELLSSGQVLAFPSTPSQLQPIPNHYEKARQVLRDTVQKIDGAYAPSTIRAYRSNFEFFIKYCEERELAALPCKPMTLANYIAHLTNGNLKSSSIRLATVAVAAIHRINRFEDPGKDPDVILELRRMFRKLGRHQKQAAAINKKILTQLIAATDQTLRGYRDRALLLTGYDSLCRRSELAALRIEDITNKKNGDGIQIRLRKSKTDQHGEGSFDKGLYVLIPFDAFFVRHSDSVANMLFTPLIRDGGDMLMRKYKLYDMTRTRDSNALSLGPTQ